MSRSAFSETWLRGTAATPDYTADPAPAKPWRMILLGAPGVGKGTQAEFLSKSLGALHLSTGDIFRAAKTLDAGALSPAMKAALGHMQRGELVPDETVIDLVAERAGCLRSPYGFLLDGYPRTVPQAQSLDALLKENGIALDAVLNFVVPIDLVVGRLGGRRTCRSCKTTFHVVNKPPRAEGVCDACSGELYQREDDRPESVRVRLEAYERSTAPLAEYYERAGLLVSVPADGAPPEVFERAMEMLGKLK